MPKKVLRSPLLKVPTTTSKVIKEVRTPWIITIERPKKVLRSPLLKVPTTNIKDITYWYCTYQNISTSVLFSLSKPSALRPQNWNTLCADILDFTDQNISTFFILSKTSALRPGNWNTLRAEILDFTDKNISTFLSFQNLQS